MNAVLNISGIIVVLALMYFFSSDRKNVKFNLIGRALLVQFILAILLVQFPYGQMLIKALADMVMLVLGFGFNGLAFVFGDLVKVNGAVGFIFIIQALGNIIFLAALVGGLYYLGVIGFVVEKIGRLVGKVTGTSEVESFVAVANMFLGQTESPLLVSRYIKYMTKSELTVVMAAGMSSMSVSILGGYAALGIPMEYLLIACAMSPIGSIIIAKVLLPEEPSRDSEVTNVTIDRKGNNTNVFEAITNGAMDGMQMVIAIAASLVAIIGIVAMVNGALSLVGIRLEQIFAWVFSPLGFFLGVDSSSVLLAGQLLGTKLSLNEFIAFDQLGRLMSEFDHRTGVVLTVAVSGFANFSSMGINISAMSVLCPEKKGIVSELVFRAMIGGFFVSVINAMIVGVVLSF